MSQEIFNIAVAIAGALGGWWLKVMWQTLKDLQKADANHYVLGDSLDLMIALYQATGALDTPSSDGVAINYDAETLNQGAVLGTDYDWDFPDSTTVRVTSNAVQNLKIRIV